MNSSTRPNQCKSQSKVASSRNLRARAEAYSKAAAQPAITPHAFPARALLADKPSEVQPLLCSLWPREQSALPHAAGALDQMFEEDS